MSIETTIAAPELTQFQARVLEYVEARRHLAQGVCHATRTIAAKFRCSVRYVQKALRRLVELGLVRRETDYGLRTRRRFFLADASPAPGLFGPPAGAEPGASDTLPAPHSFGEPEFVHSTPSSSFMDGPPLDSPLEGSGDRQEKGTGGGGPDVPPPREAESSPPPENPPADPELAARAAKVHPAHPAPARWVAALLARWSRPWVAAALARAEARAKGPDPLLNPPGYVTRTLQGFEAEGGPPAPPPTREEVRAAKAAAMDRLMAAILAPGGPGGVS